MTKTPPDIFDLASPNDPHLTRLSERIRSRFTCETAAGTVTYDLHFTVDPTDPAAESGMTPCHLTLVPSGETKILLLETHSSLDIAIARARRLASAVTWDHRWMDMANLVAGWSKDRSRKTSAVIVDDRNNLVAIGFNGFPRGLDDREPVRHERPAKYLWTEHAERNALYNAAAKGIAVEKTRMYMPWYPCADCGRAIIQSGIIEVIAIEPDWNDSKYGADFAIVREMMDEAGIRVRFMAGEAPVRK